MARYTTVYKGGKNRLNPYGFANPLFNTMSTFYRLRLNDALTKFNKQLALAKLNLEQQKFEETLKKNKAYMDYLEARRQQADPRYKLEIVKQLSGSPDPVERSFVLSLMHPHTGAMHYLATTDRDLYNILADPHFSVKQLLFRSQIDSNSALANLNRARRAMEQTRLDTLRGLSKEERNKALYPSLGKTPVTDLSKVAAALATQTRAIQSQMEVIKQQMASGDLSRAQGMEKLRLLSQDLTRTQLQLQNVYNRMMSHIALPPVDVDHDEADADLTTFGERLYNIDPGLLDAFGISP